jgi:hypothetical protein
MSADAAKEQWPKVSTRLFVAVISVCMLLDGVDHSIRANAGCVKDGNHDLILRVNDREVLRIPGISPC